MRIIAGKSTLRGRVAVPPSKSHTIRAVAIASLAGGRSTIRNPLVSADTLSAAGCYRDLGAAIDTTEPGLWKIDGNGGRIRCPGKTIDVGNSGTTLRIAMGTAALAEGGFVTLTGDEQVRGRPVAPLMDSLGDLGAECISLADNGRAPVRVTGPMTGGSTSIAAYTSQYLSSLLLCCPLAGGDSEIDVTLLNEPGYVRMTLDWLDRQGIRYENCGMKKFTVSGGQRYRPFDETVGADFSSATFFICAGALFGEEVTLTGLDFSDSQPDKAVVGHLRAMGADISARGDRLLIRSAALHGAQIDMNDTPDALPALAVTAAFAEGTTSLVNVAQARGKETDRIRSMAEELEKLGITVEELPDGLIIRGGRPAAAAVDARSDHRIVMALAMAGLGIDGGITVDAAEAVNVTFPDYVKLMRDLGADMEVWQ
jgi:3-phosphoshikimate 1-carboxyvinyltransferase